MAGKVLLVLALLTSVAVSAPFDNYRYFMMSIYDAFEGTSDALYYTCLTTTKQNELMQALTDLGTFGDSSVPNPQIAINAALIITQQVTAIYTDCKLWVIPYSFSTSLATTYNEVLTRLTLNFYKMGQELYNFFYNFGNDWSAMGTSVGTFFRLFLTPFFK